MSAAGPQVRSFPLYLWGFFRGEFLHREFVLSTISSLGLQNTISPLEMLWPTHCRLSTVACDELSSPSLLPGFEIGSTSGVSGRKLCHHFIPL